MTQYFTNNLETIVAQATPAGYGGVGIIRISGAKASDIAQQVLHKIPKTRMAEYLPFYDEQGGVLDQGIAIYFSAPNSFTGEDILELQGHGGPVVLDLIIRNICTLDGVRLANPGEFSERAFLNDKLDLTQAEAISDLISASSEQAVRSAMNSLQGAFSKEIHLLVDQIIYLRTYVEASIDFPDEEVDFLSDGKIEALLLILIEQIKKVQAQANQGTLLQEGMKVAIIGLPNAGKSSLLNALSGQDTAIVTDIEGTTRDLLKQQIHIDGLPLHIIDTAGLRETEDKIEQIGIARAWQAVAEADRLLFVIDHARHGEQMPEQLFPEWTKKLPKDKAVTIIRNKIDLTHQQPKLVTQSGYTTVYLSTAANLLAQNASEQNGMTLLKKHLKEYMGFQGNTEGQFIARRRHLDAIEHALKHLESGLEQIQVYQAGELLAEDLRVAQNYLNSITGAFTADDLLGEIFGSFCIGK